MSIATFVSSFRSALEGGYLIKLHLSSYRGPEDDLQSVIVRRVALKNGPAAQFTYRHRKKDVTKNIGLHEAPVIIANGLNAGHFSQALLFSTKEDLHLELQNLEKPRLYRRPPSTKQKADDTHNRAKKRVISAAKNGWMQALGLVDEIGAVIKSAQDKYKQINHFITQLEPAFAALSESGPVSVYDMGCGKGYLTFGLYESLSARFASVQVTGVEQRSDLVTLCNEVAHKCGFSGLSFETGTIEDSAPAAADMLVALHACDTATDDALWSGIKAGASVIVAAPCCHKQVRREMEGKPHGIFAPVSRYGVFLEREAEMLTDALRALILEYHGYQVKVLEFVSDAHTPKNVLLLATKKTVSDTRKTKIQQEIAALMNQFGITTQALAEKAGLV